MELTNKKGRVHRRFRRVSQNLAVELRFYAGGIIKGDTPPIKGIVTDMGAAGIHVLLGTAYYAGTRFQARLTLDGTPIVFYGTVKHVRWFCGTPGLQYGHGIQITEIEENTLYKIVDYVNAQYELMNSGHLAKVA